MFVGLDAVTAEFDDDIVRVVVPVRFQDGMDELRGLLRRNLVRLQLVGEGNREDPIRDDSREGKGPAAEHPKQWFVVHTISHLRSTGDLAIHARGGLKRQSWCT